MSSPSSYVSIATSMSTLEQKKIETRMIILKMMPVSPKSWRMAFTITSSAEGNHNFPRGSGVDRMTD